VAELGIVGRTKTAYDVFVGGDAVRTRLASLLIESVPFTKLGDVLGPLLDRYRGERVAGEGFGDWADRIGMSALAADLPDVASRRRERVAAS
jgi:sulfite reductase beta subunit-like hemoprotein